MNENLNLTETLKDAKGTKLYSSLCGYCKFIGIDKSSPLYIVLSDSYGRCWRVYSNGRVTEDGECVVFPSRENRDWATFKVPKKHKEFKPFQKVLVRVKNNYSNYIWIACIYSHYDESKGRHYLTNLEFVNNDSWIIPFEGNEDKLGKIVEK